MADDERALGDEHVALEGVEAVETQRTVGVLGQAAGAAERGGDEARARGELTDIEIAAGERAAGKGDEVGDGLAVERELAAGGDVDGAVAEREGVADDDLAAADERDAGVGVRGGEVQRARAGLDEAVGADDGGADDGRDERAVDGDVRAGAGELQRAAGERHACGIVDAVEFDLLVRALGQCAVISSEIRGIGGGEGVGRDRVEAGRGGRGAGVVPERVGPGAGLAGRQGPELRGDVGAVGVEEDVGRSRPGGDGEEGGCGKEAGSRNG